MATIATIATNQDNYEEVRQQYLDATGFLARVTEDFRLQFVTSPESLAAIEAVGAFNIYTQEGEAAPLAPAEFQTPGVTGDGGVKVGDSTTKTAEEDNNTGVGAGGPDPATQLTILTGEEMKWFFDSSAGKWYVQYGLPDSDRTVVFEADPDQMDALFGEDRRPTNFTESTLTNLTSGKGTFSGNIAEMEGKGKFEDEVRRIKTLALDNGTLPPWATTTGEVMDIIYIAQAEGKSQDWVVDQISKTSGFQTRFPNIDEIKTAGNLTMVDAIKGFLEFEAGVTASVKAIGGDEGSVTAAVIGGLLDKGFSLETVSTSVAKFDRMKNYAPAIQAFNSILVEQGKNPITTLQDMFNFVSGTAPADVYDIWEASSVAEAAAAAGLGDVFSAEDAMNFAIQTEGNTTLAEAGKGFRDAASLLLRLRNEVDTNKFGINQDDLISLSLGQPLSAGTSEAELTNNISRAVASAQASLQGRAKPFKGFTQKGSQTNQSLGGLRS